MEQPTLPCLNARFAPDTLVESESGTTVDLIWSTGAGVKRYNYETDEHYIEQLDMSPESVRLERLNNNAPLLLDHSNRTDKIVGVVIRAWIESGKGMATVRFSTRPEMKSIIDDVRNKIITNISVGYVIHKAMISDRSEDLPVYRVTDWEPMEISLVAVPADSKAQIRANPHPNLPTLNGETSMTEPVKTENAPAAIEPVKAVDTSALERSAAKAERERIAGITAFAASSRTAPEMVTRLIDEGVSLQDAKARMIEQWSQKVDAEHHRSDVNLRVTEEESTKQRAAASDALLARAGLMSHTDKQSKLQGNPYINHSPLRLARDCAARAGVDVNHLSDLEIVQRAISQTSSDFSVILSDTMHKSLQNGYNTASDTWRRFCSTGSVSDFRLWKRIKTGTIGNLDALGEGGEFRNKQIPDGEAESVRASTRGNIINITRQAIVNDDLSYFTRLANDLARAAARTIESSVYSTLVANAAMGDGVALFHADHGNLAGSGTAPSVATIDAARQAMAQQTDISGNDYLDIRPAIAVVPVSLGGEFRVLNAAEYDVDKAPGSTSGKNIFTPNRVRGLLNDIVDSPRLSGTAWYLFADPTVAPVLEVVFLNGNTAPYIEMQQGFEVDGLRYKVRLDYGVGVVDYRGAYKNAGA